MTKVLFNYGDEGIFFDCLNHAGDDWVCACASTLCNLLAYTCTRKGVKPLKFDEGHVQIDIPKADEYLRELFEDVEAVFQGLQEHYPEFIKMY